MNDVLAKPFTKDGMSRVLRTHLTWMLRPELQNAQEHQLMNEAGPLVMTSMSAPSSNTATGPMKFESTPSQSPATSTSWHSPGPLQQGSPSGAVMETQYGGMNPKSAQRATFPGVPTAMSGMPMSRGMEGIASDDRPEKRQRTFGPQGTFGQ